MKQLPWPVFLCLSLAACSGSKSAQNVDQDTPQIELSDADDFTGGDTSGAQEQPGIGLSDLGDDSAGFSSLEGGSTVALEDPAATPPTQDFGSYQDTATPAASDAPSFAGSSNDYSGGSEKQYTVKKNETLMLISFKLYGDYERWKELANYNRGTLAGRTQLQEGMTLKYLAPATEFVWNPEGSPYLIRTGDSLSRISGSVYNDIKKWKLIWNNNKPLIKDPNKIFAGFTIYYLENGREVASEL